MPCPFTGSKMFWAGPNVLCQTKNLFTYKKFGLAQNILGPVKGQGINHIEINLKQRFLIKSGHYIVPRPVVPSPSTALPDLVCKSRKRPQLNTALPCYQRPSIRGKQTLRAIGNRSKL